MVGLSEYGWGSDQEADDPDSQLGERWTLGHLPTDLRTEQRLQGLGLMPSEFWIAQATHDSHPSLLVPLLLGGPYLGYSGGPIPGQQWVPALPQQTDPLHFQALALLHPAQDGLSGAGKGTIQATIP
ncbi:hypothetical protein NDU88_003919 [Pleurodeles waltl]|uniref:Uncharacterized protein n=1 Tax=Pleurodeles waltl TaxID=8319 RepID=A0AAV7LJU2_PLEWA|nr:hypothetical protein NDU88_003919 [Pleurodeles waltl]